MTRGDPGYQAHNEESFIGQTYEYDPPKKHEGYHRIETAEFQQKAERMNWRKQMGFPEPDAGANLGPPSLNDDVMYYLTRAEGQLVRLNELLQVLNRADEMKHIVKSVQSFLSLLRTALDKNRFDVT